VLFDEQFNAVITSDGRNSSVQQVGGAGSLLTLGVNGWELTKNGYLYVYVSNETPNQDVYFDNLQVTHIHGPITEETHYYPFGLTMQGISSRASYFGSANKYKFGGKEEQRGEFSDGAGLEALDFGARLLDPQLGIWHSIDPLCEASRRWSPYVYTAANPIRFIDPDGMAYMGYGHDDMDQVVADGEAIRIQGPDVYKNAKNDNRQSVEEQAKQSFKRGDYFQGIMTVISAYSELQIAEYEKDYSIVVTNGAGYLTDNASFKDADTNEEVKFARITVGKTGLDQFANGLASFGSVVRSLFHELVHVEQLLGLNGAEAMPSSNQRPEREFLAYYRSLTQKTLPQYNNLEKVFNLKMALTDKITNRRNEPMGNYYNRLPEEKKLQYLSEYHLLSKMLASLTPNVKNK
jgi:RHS repeat-associated protein